MTPSEKCFWKYVKKGQPDECWEWSGFCRPTGYGSNATMEEPRAHRMSWQIHNGPIPAGLHVLHRCDNPPCCNPNHLFLGTVRDNMEDRDRKGRQVSMCGENFKNHKLKTEDVLKIREMKVSGMNAVQISSHFPVGVSQIKRIIRGESRKHE